MFRPALWSHQNWPALEVCFILFMSKHKTWQMQSEWIKNTQAVFLSDSERNGRDQREEKLSHVDHEVTDNVKAGSVGAERRSLPQKPIHSTHPSERANPLNTDSVFTITLRSVHKQFNFLNSRNEVSKTGGSTENAIIYMQQKKCNNVPPPEWGLCLHSSYRNSYSFTCYSG